MADGKWITGLRPNMPVLEAAALVLATRLPIVPEQLARVRQLAHKDIEPVHQLRVATRRADAAVRLFRSCLPHRLYRKIRRRLRRMRQAAGAARDWDVFLLELRQRQKTAEQKQLPGLDFLIGYALGQRAAAQQQLDAVETLESDQLEDFLRQVLNDLHAPHEGEPQQLGELAHEVLHDRLQMLQTAASGDLSDYEQLHQVRIAGKRLRYAMEILSDCFPPSLREDFYPRVEAMQDILGRANDSHVATSRLLALRKQLRHWPEEWSRLRPGIEGLLHSHQRRLLQERRRFLNWWKQWQQAEPLGLLQLRGQ
jgi:CHAD domain-containing protein